MNLRSRLFDDMKTAMKEREAGKPKLAALRMVISNIRNSEIERKRELDDEEITTLLSKEVKMRRDAIEEFKNAGRDDLVAQYSAEIAVYCSYLPEQMGEAEIVKLVSECIEKSGATNIKEIGKVMSLIVPLTKGRADGKLVSQIVRELLK